MFTGLIEEIGEIYSVRRNGSSFALSVRAKTVMGDLKPGDSIAVNGVCLTVTGLRDFLFTADVMSETLERTSLKEVKAGSHVNLERAIPMNGRFGGHIVSGHIDGTGLITAVRRDGIAIWYTIKASGSIMRYIVEKGSVAVDGISLTVADRATDRFKVELIPHTLKASALSEKPAGSIVNLENDIIGKYVEQLSGAGKASEKRGGITLDLLEH